MTSRFSQLVFAPVPSHLDALPSPDSPSLLSKLRQTLSTDEELALRLQQGQADALTVLFRRHSPLLFGIARRILRNESEAEDSVQQIFLDVFRSIHQFDPARGSFKSWLVMFAYQRTFNARRAMASNRYFQTDSFDEAQLFRQPPGAAETSILVNQLLSTLEPRQRRTIELIYGEGLTAEEAALRTGETVRVVRHNLYRGLEKIRKNAKGGRR
ncbi:RNA polymerase sigma-70 factor, ECF subfamily [Granulicella pectinivorans]|uniref:RNA polymerase sigma-70 factor, ECF subfamily n=1 Tax=Granulicella pectinivorans TaxID=474950 RepID=A0A1I6MLE6_9BACT|nr:sigma-70 family RNA polymerase sigma factor [Granulicella pectinivorans]SFS16523.1 RNA polymerase sigma-70 factor, ECF subfamily [Granulicella pectinivorans]